MESKVYTMDQDVTQGAGEGLFDYIAECLANFMKEQGYTIQENLIHQDNQSAIKMEKNGNISNL